MTLPLPDKELGIDPRPCGSSEQEGRNWDAVRRALGRYNIRRFYLTEDLELGGSAAAVLQRWNIETQDFEDIRAIVVHDEEPDPGHWEGAEGAEGWCTPRGNSNTQYSIVWMDDGDGADEDRQFVNAVFCPLGKSPTRAWMLMTPAQLAALDVDGINTITPTGWSQAFQGFYLVKAEKLRVPPPGMAADTYFVQLADARWKCSQASDTESINANIRSYAQSDSYLDGTDGVTWESLTQDLWDACALLGAYPGLPFAPDHIPENTRFIGVNAWTSLCTLLDLLDCAVKHDPITNTYTIVQLGAAQSIPAEGGSLLWNGSPATYTANHTAATVRVYFHHHYRAYGQERDTEIDDNWSYNGAGVWEDIGTFVTGSQGVIQLWDDMPKVILESGADGNNGNRNTRLIARRDRYVTRRGVTNVHRIHNGLLTTLLPGGQIRATLWRDKSSGTGQYTEFVAQADLITEPLYDPGGFPEGLTDAMSVTQENYSPPDITRQTYPNYPRLPNIVQVYDSVGTQGQRIPANDDGVHPGRVRRWVNGSMEILEDCWIRFVDDHDNLEGDVPAIDGELYGPARLSGTLTSETVTKPLYLVRSGDAQAVRRFRLTTNLSNGGEAAAVLRIWNGDAYVDGAAITVVDWYGVSQGGRGMFQGVTGMEGFCYRRELGAKYDIIWMEQYAFGIEFTLLSRFVDGEATALVEYSWHQGIAPGQVVVVHDDTGRFTNAVPGNKGTAWRSEYMDAGNPANPWYKVVHCQVVWAIGFTLLSDMFAGAAVATVTSSTDGDISGDEVIVYDLADTHQVALTGAKGTALCDNGDLTSWRVVDCEQVALFASATLGETVCDPSVGRLYLIYDFGVHPTAQFNQSPNPAPTRAFCMGIMGMAGDRVLLRRYANRADAWEIITIEQHKVKMVTDVFGVFSGGGDLLRVDKTWGYVGVNLCELPATTEPVITFDPCE